MPSSDNLSLPSLSLKCTSTGSDGEKIEFTTGEGIRIEAQSEDSDEQPSEKNDEKQELSGSKPSFLYASLSGSVRYVRNKLEVLPLLIINGDVDLNVGHISTRGDVKIGGSIQFGFNITAGGNIDIAGGVENGVTIRSEGDVTVNKSVIGERTRIIAGGDVEAGVAAQLDPLGIAPTRKDHLELQTFGLSKAQLNEPFDPGHLSLPNPSTLQTIIDSLETTYCKHIGVEYAHIEDRDAQAPPKALKL